MESNRDGREPEGSSHSTATGRRKYISSLIGIAGAATLAGCTGEDVDGPEQVTDGGGTGSGGSDGGDGGGGDGGDTGDGDGGSSGTTDGSTSGTVEAALGEVVESETLALVVYDVERTTEVGEFVQADAGNEFVVLDVAAKNKASEEFVRFSSFLQVTLRDSESYEYDQALTGSDTSLGNGELAPGEVTRGTIAFEVPEEASGLSLRVNLDESVFSSSRVEIDLESRGSGRTLTQDLRVEVYEVGDTLEYENTRFTPNEVRTSTGGQYFSPDEGNEFVIVDVTVGNTGDEDLSVSILLQMELKDAAGRTYTTSVSAMSSLDRGFSQGQAIAPGDERRGEVAFEAPEGVSPLYMVLDFDLFAEGDKTFFRLR